MRSVAHKLLDVATVTGLAVTLILGAGSSFAKTAASTSPQASTTPAAPAAPAPAPAAAATPAPPAKFEETTSVTSKNIEITKISTSGLNKGVIDIYFTLTNTGKADDALTGAESDVSDNLAIYTGASGQETVSPNFRVDVAAGKTAELASGKQVLRLSDVAKTVKDGDHIQVFLHFRSAPNAKLELTVKKKSFLGL